MLSDSCLLNGWALREYVLSCQSPYGGFGKVAGVMPDLLHSFYTMCWLATIKEQGYCNEEHDGNDDGETTGGVDKKEEAEKFGTMEK